MMGGISTCNESAETIRVLVVRPGRFPTVEDIPHTLEAMQELVGGNIQAVYPWDDPVGIVCDEEGLYKETSWNRQINNDLAIKGTFFLCGLDDEDFTSLPEPLIKKYRQMLFCPQIVVCTSQGYQFVELDMEF